MSKIGEFFGTRLKAIVIWVVVLLALYGIVVYSRASQARQEAALASASQDTRDAAVQGLVNRGSLIDTLINTENPNEDPTSPQNVLSVKIRQDAADSVNRLAATKKISLDDAMETLFQLRKDGDSGVQGKATDGLVALAGQSDANLQKIVTHLSNGDPDIRSAASDVLVKIGGDKAARAADAVLTAPASADAASGTLLKIGEPAVPLIVAHLEDPKAASDIAFRGQLLTMLDTLTSPTAVPELIKLSGQAAQPSIQRQAQITLADTVLAAYTNVKNSQDALKAAQDAQAKATGKAQGDAAKAVGDAQKAEMTAADVLPKVQIAEPALTAVLSNVNADSLARSQSALVLGRIGGPGATQILVLSLGDLDSRVRDAAQAAVQTVGASAIAPLTTTLAQGSPDAQAEAAEALGGIGSPASQASLNSLLTNPHSPVQVRQAAVIGLGRSGQATAIPALVRALGDPDGGVESAASEALLTPALEKAAIPSLVAAFAAPTPVPFNASQTLSRMGSLIKTDVVPALQTAIASGTPQAQTWAAVTLGQSGGKDPAVMTSLQRLAGSKDPHVQYAATQAISQLSAGA